MHLIDESTCCDEDFTWVRSEPPVESRSLPNEQVINTPPANNSAKPPRPAGSLDRRRISHTNRQERDSKSRSAHSLKERSVSGEFKDSSHEKGSHALCFAYSVPSNFDSISLSHSLENEKSILKTLSIATYTEFENLKVITTIPTIIITTEPHPVSGNHHHRHKFHIHIGMHRISITIITELAEKNYV